MAIAEDRQEACDGCGRSVPVDTLVAVTLAGGDQLAFCPECEPYAREAAKRNSTLDQQRGVCDGCNSTLPRDELEDIVLPDGAVVWCCPTCLVDAVRFTIGDDAEDVDDLDDLDGDFDDLDEPEDDEDDEDDGSRGSLCTQCRGWVHGELYTVELLNGRTERLCRGCKGVAEERNVIKDVKMRATEARRLLGVSADATSEEIRAAYIEQVKRAHPDRKEGSCSAFKLVTEAYEVLT